MEQDVKISKSAHVGSARLADTQAAGYVHEITEKYPKSELPREF